MTEEEARTKWCPHQSQQMFGYQHLMTTGQIDISQQQLDCSCIASDCMMWVELTNGEPYKFEDVGNDTVECVSAPSVIAGHCGLINT